MYRNINPPRPVVSVASGLDPPPQGVVVRHHAAADHHLVVLLDVVEFLFNSLQFSLYPAIIRSELLLFSLRPLRFMMERCAADVFHDFAIPGNRVHPP